MTKKWCSLESSRSSEFDDATFDFPAGNLAQARQLSLKQVLRRKK